MKNITDYINEARVAAGPKYILGEETRIKGGSRVEHSEVGGSVRLDGEEVVRQKLK